MKTSTTKDYNSNTVVAVDERGGGDDVVVPSKQSEMRRRNESAGLPPVATKRREDMNATESITMGPSRRHSTTSDRGGIHPPERHSTRPTIAKDAEDAQHVAKSTGEKKHHHKHHKKRKHHKKNTHEGLDEPRRSSPLQPDAALTKNEMSGGSANVDRSMTQPQGDKLHTPPPSVPHGDEKCPASSPSSIAESDAKHTLAAAVAKDSMRMHHPEGAARHKKKKEHATVAHGSDLWHSSKKPAAHRSTTKFEGKSVAVSYKQSDSDSIGHMSSNMPTDKKHKASFAPQQPENLDIAAQTTPALGLMTHSPADEWDLESGVVEISNEVIGDDIPRVPPQPIAPGAIAMSGPNAPSNDDSVLNFTTIESTHPEQAPMETPISATLVDTEEERRRLKEEIRNSAPMAEIVINKCTPAKVRRYTTAGIIVVLGAAIVGVVVWVLTRPGPEPTEKELLETLLSSVSFDGGAALQTQSTPQNRAFNWLANNTTNLNLHSEERKIQRYVLATLFFSTNGYGWENMTDWISDRDECTWYNYPEDLFCDETGSIVELILHSNKLSGTIPNELALLSNSIGWLDLSGNSLTGTIPSEIGRLTQLNELNLGGNGLLLAPFTAID